jgi:hypothetical protein
VGFLLVVLLEEEVLFGEVLEGASVLGGFGLLVESEGLLELFQHGVLLFQGMRDMLLSIQLRLQ